ncbi:MAG: prepilin-type N-terminal cleavage/methylation domain-containing protein [Candidatus Dadabacteria bacterium]|nr:prepilin-type N-terminal cleavage/methylation domain-containing protein [Candidatus Dadabacteria bacterium]MCY4262110.1 prepilin-type N-terminal cleavage/methylation domain-containing protein [Candidatus Dadabacteria bacterium]
MRDSEKNIRGFTLLEVMVAVGLLAFAMVAILGTVSYNINLAGKANDNMIAMSLADEMASRIDAEGLPSASQKSGRFENHPDFQWYVSVTPFNLSQFKARMNLVSIIITWDEEEESYEITFVHL